MKKLYSFLIAILWCGISYCQTSPQHPFYYTYPMDDTKIWEWWDDYEVGDPLCEDDAFFISRVRLKKRFVNKATQVNPNLDPKRRVCSWDPIGTEDKRWKQLPRYNFNSDNFSMWQYLDVHGNWGNHFLRAPAGYQNVASRNGVQTGSLLFLDWMEPIGPNSNTAHSNLLMWLSAKNSDGTFKNTRKLARFLKYYGMTGLGIDGEASFTPQSADRLQDAFRDLNVKAKEEGVEGFQILWYDAQNNDGNIDWYNGLTQRNRDWFFKNGEYVFKTFLLNYNFTKDKNEASVRFAESIGADPYTVYAGFNPGERGMSHNFNGGPGTGWEILPNSKIGIWWWGGYGANTYYEASAEQGAEPLTWQKTYQKKLELIYSGGNQNPANTPAITNTIRNQRNESLKRFHGIASLAVAKSTITEMPFVTRFGLGNGMRFSDKGKVTFDKGWYNIGIQDYLPTWRWWVTNDGGQVPADPINLELSFDDAYFAGNCLKVSGNTSKSNVNLFKTKLAMSSQAELKVVYRVENGSDPKMNIRLSKEGSETIFTRIPLPTTDGDGWKTYTCRLADHGISSGDVVAMLGIEVEGTAKDYVAYIGEISLNDPSKAFQPAKPQILKYKNLKESYDKLSFKLFWDSKPGAPKGTVVYNDEVDTWYFEILLQEGQSEPVLLNACTEWAGLVVDAPLNPENGEYRIGVRAVAPDGVTKSEIAWTRQVKSARLSTDVEVDRPYINPGQTVTLKLKDPNISQASWEIIGNGITVVSKTGTEITLNMDQLGSYGAKLIVSGNGQTVEKNLEGIFSVIPKENGCTPQMEFVAENNPAQIPTPAKLKFTGIKGEGKISTGVQVSTLDHIALSDKIIGTQNKFTYGFWFNADLIANDRMRLFGKRREDTGTRDFDIKVRATGELEFFSRKYTPMTNVLKNTKVEPGKWTHLAMAYNGSSLVIYINGREVRRWENRQLNLRQHSDAFIVLGDLSFRGKFDELQLWNRMLTPEEIRLNMNRKPLNESGLIGYWDFDKKNGLGQYVNQGSFGGNHAFRAKNPTGKKEVLIAPMAVAGCPVIGGDFSVNPKINWGLGELTYELSGDSVDVSYGTPGLYNVNCMAESVLGHNELLKDNFLKITAPDTEALRAGFNVTSRVVEQGNEIVFYDASYGVPETYEWTFEGGSPKNGDSKERAVTYHVPGTYKVTLKVLNSQGEDILEKSDYITVKGIEAKERPAADFRASKTALNKGESVIFEDLSANAPSQWAWTFEGGEPAESNDKAPEVTYSQPGTYRVTLTVRNSKGENTATKNTYITVAPFTSDVFYIRNVGTGSVLDILGANEFSGAVATANTEKLSQKWRRKPTADGAFHFDNESGALRLNAPKANPVRVISDANAGMNVRWKLKFLSNGYVNIIHLGSGLILHADKDGKVTLVSSQTTGSNVEWTFDENPTAGPKLPIVDFKADITKVKSGGSVSFTDLTVNGTSSRIWTFEGGTPKMSEEESPEVVYNKPGVYKVALTVNNMFGDGQRTKEGYITVSAFGTEVFYIRNVATAEVLDIAGKISPSDVIVTRNSDKLTQQWRKVDDGEGAYHFDNEGGALRLNAPHAGSLAFDVRVIGDANSGKNVRWTLKHLPNGHVNIVHIGSGKILRVNPQGVVDLVAPTVAGDAVEWVFDDKVSNIQARVNVAGDSPSINQEKLSDIVVFPNPVKAGGELRVECFAKKEGELAEFRIHDIMGNTVLKRNVPLEKGNNRIQLEINLTEGVYVLEVSLEEFMETFRILVR
ncbi:hypothetical protein FUAX_18830 [Fulvitalea axinellae]|uniref:PKD domain-containing protein n=1 Tax=Fulvitalea axinellae TaxID=1182444 RepID=A0AAU9CKH2_9BACT|nr:hypothetical protein FUAX_18830 [Fulvitalea axinellae]